MATAHGMRVHLFPRRKAGDETVPEKGRRPVEVDLRMIQGLFGVPQPDAAAALGVSLTALKQVCRKLGIPRWPYQRPTKHAKLHKHGKRHLHRASAAVERPCRKQASWWSAWALLLHSSQHPSRRVEALSPASSPSWVRRQSSTPT